MAQDILQQIKTNKQVLINKAYEALFSFPHLKDLYRKFGEGSFAHFCNYIFHGLDDIKESSGMIQEDIIARPIDEKDYTPEIYSKIIEKRSMIARNMLQVDYKAPLFNDEDSLIRHLHIMWHLYDKGDFLALSIEGICLDLSFAKLLSAAHRRIASDLNRAEWAEKTTGGTKKSRRKNLEPEIKAIKEIFNKLVIPPQAKKHHVAELIKAHGRPEHLDTIKNYMESDPEIWKFFKKKGRFWVYENVTPSYEDKEM